MAVERSAAGGARNGLRLEPDSRIDERKEVKHMEENYESPSVTVLGTVTDMTMASNKPGIYFDFGNCNQGAKSPSS
jgi:hypothetical protein